MIFKKSEWKKVGENEDMEVDGHPWPSFSDLWILHPALWAP